LFLTVLNLLLKKKNHGARIKCGEKILGGEYEI